ncbi:MAG: hypothetical protein ACRCSF_02220 [Mycobacteriaceae bacterium]
MMLKIVPVVIVSFLIVLFIFPVKGDATPTELQNIQLKAPPSVTAGGSVTIAVEQVKTNTSVSLLVIGSFGTVRLFEDSIENIATFTLGESITRVSGDISVVAVASGSAATTVVRVLPGPAVNPVTPVVGARSIVADNTDTAMVVAMPTDRFGNVISDGSLVQVIRVRPDGSTERTEVPIVHQIAWQPVIAGTLAGKGEVSVQAQEAIGPRVSLDEVAAPPLPFGLKVADAIAAKNIQADGQALLAVRTEVLKDFFGNIQPDGTLVTFEWEHVQGRSLASVVTLAGVAELFIPAPQLPGTIKVTARCRGISANQDILLNFASAVRSVGIAAKRVAAGVEVAIGPVQRVSGAFVPDGSIVEVEIRDNQNITARASGQLIDGILTIIFPPDARWRGPLTVTARVLGSSDMVVLQ